MSDYKVLLKGSTVSFVTLLCSIFIAFFMMPFIIHNIGGREYGLWVIIGSILSFYGMMDLGLSSATQRFLSYSLPQNNKVKFNEYFNSSLFCYSLISITVLVITFFIVLFSDSFIDKPEDLQTFKAIVTIMGSTLAISFPFYVINGMIVANMRYDIAALINLTKIIIRAACTYLALSNGHGIIAMAIITSATDFLANLVLTRFAIKLTPWVKLDKSLITKESIKELFSFSAYSLVGSSANRLGISAAPLIVSYSLNLSSVTLYAIAAQFMSYFKQAISALLVVTLPLFTKNISLNDTEKTHSDFIFATKIACVTSTIGALIIALLCTPFIAVWMGSDFVSAASTVIILISGTAFVTCQQPSTQFFFAASKNKYHTWMVLFETSCMLLVGLSLAEYYGINGVALALIAPQVIVKTFVQPVIICRLLKTSLWGYSTIFIKQFFAVAITTFIFSLIDFNESYLHLLLMAILIAMTHSLISLYIVFSHSDRAIIFKFIGDVSKNITSKLFANATSR